jgi:hypothetical protein
MIYDPPKLKGVPKPLALAAQESIEYVPEPDHGVIFLSSFRYTAFAQRRGDRIIGAPPDRRAQATLRC